MCVSDTPNNLPLPLELEIDPEPEVESEAEVDPEPVETPEVGSAEADYSKTSVKLYFFWKHFLLKV